MKKTKIRVAIIVTLSVIAIALGVIAFLPPKESIEIIDVPVSTPEVVFIDIIPTPSPTPPQMPVSTLEESEVAAVLTPIPEATMKPESTTNISGAFALRIGSSTIQIAYGVDESTLKKTPGWLDTSARPGEEGVCVIYGHRNRNHLKVLKDVETGDAINITVPDGKRINYIIESIEIIDSDEKLQIPTVTGSYLLLATCYPFYYSGQAPQQYVVFAHKANGSNTIL